MKRLNLLVIFILVSNLLCAQEEQRPEFPGGVQGFEKYISKNLKYPEVARLIGMNGKVNVFFVIDKNGKITDVTTKKCIGAGCEAEAVKVIKNCPAWKPGFLYGRPVSFMYIVPIRFDLGEKKVKTYLHDLRKSNYGFVFNIKGGLYTIDEAEKIIGRGFMSDQIQVVEPFYSYNKVEKFKMPNKKEVYLLIFKST